MNSSRTEKRLSNQLIAYWKKLKKGPELPDIRQFNPNAIEAIWPRCFRLLVTGTNNTKVYKYDYMGEEIIKAYGKDLTGQQVTSSIRVVPGATIIKKLDEAISMTEPVLEQGSLINDHNKMVKYRSCILPFRHDNYDLSHVVIGLSWKIF